MAQKNKTIGILLTFICLGILIPGVVMPIFELQMDASVKTSLANINLDVISQKRSIFGTVEELWQKQKYLVSFLIFFFSVIVPFIKLILSFRVFTTQDDDRRKKTKNFLGAIGKWSMADVFVVGVFLAYLATEGTGAFYESQLKVFGMQIPIKMVTQVKSNIGPGFYFFVSYCLLSIGLTHLVKKKD